MQDNTAYNADQTPKAGTMCGICGIALPRDNKADPGLIEKMNRVMAHRGPDGSGVFTNQNVGFGHLRLAIIDLVTGEQPMKNSTGDLVITYNGEIYNYQELKKELEAQGHHFRTKSDTETLIHLYQQHGIDMLHKLRGMFAFALYDIPNEVVYVVRDRFGIKPLYYAETNNGLYFASEIKPLLAAGIPVEVNKLGIHQYLSTRFAHGDQTIFKGIHRLPEGSYLRWQAGSWSLHSYYPNPAVPGDHRSRDFLEEMEENLAQAVKLHMIADVPVGAYLSGGVDSSVLVKMMTGFTDKPVRTFCIDFSSGLSEAGIAEKTARQLGCDHTTVRFGVEELGALPQVISALEEPVGDGITVSQYFLAQATQQAGIKTVLTGDGADEIFGGYQFLRFLVMAATWGHRLPNFLFSPVGSGILKYVPASLLQLVSDLPFSAQEEIKKRGESFLKTMANDNPRKLYDLMLALYSQDELAEIYTDDFWGEIKNAPIEYFSGEMAGSSRKDQALSLQYRKWLPANINMKQDRMSMAFSVENRVPFLDHNLVEFAVSLPLSQKIQGKKNKIILRELAKKLELSPQVHSGRKVPFHLPLQEILSHPRLKDMVTENLDLERVRRRGIIRPEYVKALRDKLASGDYITSKKIFSLVILELWHRIFVDREIEFASW